MKNNARLTQQTTALAAATMFAVFFAAQMQTFAQTDWLKSPSRDLMIAINGYELNEAAAKDALKRGADINWKNGDETLLIMEIKSFQKPEAVKFLLENGADPNLKDDSGRTALSWARQRLPNNRVGRELLALLEAATGQAAKTNQPAANAGGQPSNMAKTAPPKTAPGKTPVTASKTPRRTGGAPTAEEIKETLEKSFTGIYQSHFFGVKNIVTFEWIGAITVGAPEIRGAFPTRCYPAKLNVKVTAEDPRDGSRSTVARGTEADSGGYLKTEIFCFSRNGFGEWKYLIYVP